MTPAEAIEAVEQCFGTMVEKLAVLVATLPEIDVPGDNAVHIPRCACGASLTVWNGRHSGRTIVFHPVGMRSCPRTRFWVDGKDPADAMKIYVSTAPDIGALDEIPSEDDNPFADEFSDRS